MENELGGYHGTTTDGFRVAHLRIGQGSAQPQTPLAGCLQRITWDFGLIGRNGSSEALLTPTSNEKYPDDGSLVTSWVEVVNVTDSPVNVTAILKSELSGEIRRQQQVIGA